MSSADPVEWRLYSSDLITQLCILPMKTSHIYLQNNDPGSGELTLPLDNTAAPQVAIGQLAVMYYRGSQRASFFVENLKYTDADAQEGGGRALSMSGRGPLALLAGSVIENSAGNTDTSRTFTGVTKASILKTLIDEAQARGELATLAYSFTASVDTSSVAWTDSETYSLSIGMSLLDAARQFAGTGGFDFSLTFSGGIFTLNAYKNGRGTDKTSTIYFRVGSNCEEVGRDERGDEIYNIYYVKYKDGYVTVSDSASIASYGRRVKFLSLEQAQSSDSATTYASAQLALTKGPKANKTVKLFDNINPRLFVDYDLGDTVKLDRFGTETSDKILGIQADFSETDAGYAEVVIDFNIIQYNNELKMAGDLSWLLSQWNTAKDANLQEVKQWLAFGNPNGEVYALFTQGDWLYVGGAFTVIGGVYSPYIAEYQISTHTWFGLGTTIPEIVHSITYKTSTAEIWVATDLYVYKYTGSWSLIGTVGANNHLTCITNDGTNIYVGGSVLDHMSGVSIVASVAKWNGSVWSSVSGAGDTALSCGCLLWWNSALYAGFNANQGSGNGSNIEDSFQKFTTAWNPVWTIGAGHAFVRAAVIWGNNIALLDSTQDLFLSWDGAASSPTTLGAIDITHGVLQDTDALAVYLSDVFMGSQFTTVGGLAASNIARYSGGIFSKLSSGMSNASGARHDRIAALVVIGSDLYAGGLFTTAGGTPINNLAVWVTNFQSLTDHLANDKFSSYDLGAGIHNATAAAITDSGEMPFWDSVTTALRKITWANIKATLKTYFDTIYRAIGLTNPSLTAVIATTTLLPAYTYSGSTLTLTGNSTGTLTIDGHLVALNEYVLVKDEIATRTNNGLYKCTTAGAVGVAYVLTRAVEMDSSAEFPGAVVYIELGTANAATGWMLANNSVTMDSTNISFTQITTPPATAPASGLLNVLAIASGETARSDKAIFDTTNPAAVGTAGPGTQIIAARRDHIHAADYLSLTTRPAGETNTNDIFSVAASPGGTSAWTGTINGAPSGASVTLTTSTGTKASLKPASTSQLGKMVLYNTTRSNSALISDFNTATNVCTLTANAPGSWANGDSLTISSQTVTGSGQPIVDIQITSGPTGHAYMFLGLVILSATAGDRATLHPFETFSASKYKNCFAQAANITNETGRLLKINSNTFSLFWTGTPTNVVVREDGYLE